ncbi:MAG: XRE family transcriptional regulator [Lachnospiraceae bacterium]|nr:XRE family transcriptional regulator [Lachnospiraceae bacterium]
MKIYKYKNKSNVIGPIIRNARINMDLTQESLAIKMQLENVEMSQKIISRIEKQERFVTDYELLTLLKILKLNTSDLVELLEANEK